MTACCLDGVEGLNAHNMFYYTYCIICICIYIILYKYDMHLYPTYTYLKGIIKCNKQFHAICTMDLWYRDGQVATSPVLEASHTLIFTGFFVLHQKGPEVWMGWVTHEKKLYVVRIFKMVWSSNLTNFPGVTGLAITVLQER